MLEPLGNPSFRRLWLADLLSKTGSQISRIAIILFLFETRHAVAPIALLVVFNTLPAALTTSMTGFIADRCGKRIVMVGADLVRVALLLVTCLQPEMGVILAAQALDSFAAGVFEPAKNAAIPFIVGRDEVVKANGLLQAAGNVTMIIGPMIGAELFLWSGLRGALLIDALSFAASAWLVLRASITDESGVPAAAPVMTDIRLGWSYVGNNSALTLLAVLLFVSMLCGGIWVPLAPLFVHAHFAGSPERVLGWQLAVFGLGGAVGGALAPRLEAWSATRGSLFFGGLIGESLYICMYPMVRNMTWSLAILFLWGATVSLIAVSGYSIMHTTVPDRFMNRVFAIVQQGESAAMLLAMGAAVLLSRVLSTQEIFVAAGLTYCGIVLAVARTSGGRALRLC